MQAKQSMLKSQKEYAIWRISLGKSSYLRFVVCLYLSFSDIFLYRYETCLCPISSDIFCMKIFIVYFEFLATSGRSEPTMSCILYLETIGGTSKHSVWLLSKKSLLFSKNHYYFPQITARTPI